MSKQSRISQYFLTTVSPTNTSKCNDVCQSSNIQTIEWRKNQEWYIDGKHNECEKQQKQYLERALHIVLNKTNERLHYHKLIIQEKTKPMNDIDGFEWSENFDGVIFVKHKIVYFNLKMVCGKGGAQTRTLREIYHFIKHQVAFLNSCSTNNVVFINVLDGDECQNHMDKFKKMNHKWVFIGDMRSSIEYIKQTIL